jgi:hypothetical protein
MLLVLCVWLPSRADAGLTASATFVGTVGLSTDGFGSLSQSGTISADVPAGATVLAAFLYTTTFGNSTLAGVGGTLNGTAVSFASLGTDFASCCALTAGRATVTSIVAPVINGGPGGVYNFTVTETSDSQDGEALVVVYNLASLPQGTVGILDGFATVTGDTTSINFATPLDPTATGFFAEMNLGIGFSCCGSQQSTVTVNGTLITQNAGNMDDADDLSPADGRLITVGGFDDPFSPLLPSYDPIQGPGSDHERYNLVPQISLGDTSIVIDTANASLNDIIFLAALRVSGEAGINEPPPSDPIPEPATFSLLTLGLAGYGLNRFRRRSRSS